MAVIPVGIIMHGVTGRMGTNQHLIRSILAIREDGGVKLKSGDYLMPDPILVGRDENKLERLAKHLGVDRWEANIDKALANPKDIIFFDSAMTKNRPGILRKAIDAGKHIYTEKPVATNLNDALELYHYAKNKGVCHGVVQDKLWLPGLQKLQLLNDSGFFGKVHSVRGDFGYWVFEGDLQPTQRPSWNYRKEDGGGLILDMFCHWRYVIDNLFGEIKSVSCIGATHIPQRFDEHGVPYEATADDAAYATFELHNGTIVHMSSSWCVRVRRDDLVTFQVDGTNGSAVAGLTECFTQSRVQTPRPVWNPDVPRVNNYFDDWLPVPDTAEHANAFRSQWELYLKHVCGEDDFRWDLLAGAKGVQLVELALQSWKERRWLDVPPLV
ncbi:Gfo/Idh/MocA family oxidoreductase [Salmonella enterica subsp. enterica]|nr:Gfo/Idh/MocA family oxidoreductase [Salmonella enterica]EBY0806090.1 gfo/Idh/MocA family oxidoreductase [Salmonella enterica subsp. enterica serovar Berlin]ECF3779999.1 Gfo/Idh/MocA family oxidoreductase [Salmonella enterica subsp. enterica serovar Oslo]EDR2104881.1 Gfo/Idh/MocA family oxidoreductase [Salmonella enterica subsp. enterica]EDW0612925.1 Gfo/Idh/MocA family oxidoreductase [Salmonella enterica subsp. enterica serovar Ball]EGZ4376741.1 Gfo/Idh/MocA family oxidoreductase [Salmonell